MTEYVGSFLSGLIFTGMIQQLFPDGRFPLYTTALVVLASTVGAYIAQHYFASASLFTAAFVGAAVVSLALLFLFHTTGWLVLDVPVAPTEEPTDTEKEE